MKCFSGPNSDAWLQKGTQERKQHCVLSQYFLPRKANRKRELFAASVARRVQTGHKTEKRRRPTWVSGNGLNLCYNRWRISSALKKWKTAGLLVDCGCTYHTVANIDMLPDLLPIQSEVRIQNWEASRVFGWGCFRISVPQPEWKFKPNWRTFVCAWLFFSLPISLNMQALGTWLHFGEKKRLRETAEGNSDKTNSTYKLVLVTLQSFRVWAELQLRENLQCS